MLGAAATNIGTQSILLGAPGYWPLLGSSLALVHGVQLSLVLKSSVCKVLGILDYCFIYCFIFLFNNREVKSVSLVQWMN